MKSGALIGASGCGESGAAKSLKYYLFRQRWVGVTHEFRLVVKRSCEHREQSFEWNDVTAYRGRNRLLYAMVKTYYLSALIVRVDR